jgi:hypothetical protein
MANRALWQYGDDTISTKDMETLYRKAEPVAYQAFKAAYMAYRQQHGGTLTAAMRAVWPDHQPAANTGKEPLPKTPPPKEAEPEPPAAPPTSWTPEQLTALSEHTKVTYRESVEWIFDALGRAQLGLELLTPPDPGTAAWFDAVNKDGDAKQDFYRNHWSKLAPARAEIERSERFKDDDRDLEYWFDENEAGPEPIVDAAEAQRDWDRGATGGTAVLPTGAEGVSGESEAPPEALPARSA